MTDFEKKFTNLPQYKHGKLVEEYLDGYFKLQGYGIRKTTEEEERKLFLGDRQFYQDEWSAFIDYKSGIQTHYTGNIFLETISVDKPGYEKPGWVFTTKADVIIYATILEGCLLLFLPDKLRSKMPLLKKKFREVSTSHNQNNGYKTHGLIIPFDVAKKEVADGVTDLVVDLRANIGKVFSRCAP